MYARHLSFPQPMYNRLGRLAAIFSAGKFIAFTRGELARRTEKRITKFGPGVKSGYGLNGAVLSPPAQMINVALRPRSTATRLEPRVIDTIVGAQ